MQPFSRVFALAPDCHAAGNRYGRVWKRHFYDGLRNAVSKVVVPQGIDFSWARPASTASTQPSRLRAAVSQRLREQIAASGCDAVVSYCFSTDIDPGLVRDTVSDGVPWVNFFCDSTYAFDRVESLAREASLNWFPEGAAEARYRALGRPYLCRPYALNPEALPEAVCEAALHGLGFVGAPTAHRALRLLVLRFLGCPVTIRGERWREQPGTGPSTLHMLSVLDPQAWWRIGDRLVVRALRPLLQTGSRLEDDELSRFVSGCRVVLGLNEGGATRRAERSYLKLRDVEFPGYGACYLTQHNGDVARAFEIGREVLTFRGPSEAAAIVRECVAHPQMARTIGQAGRRRVLVEHTWTARLGEIARAI